MTTTTKIRQPRVLIDFASNGKFFIYSDQEVEVICRDTDSPHDELYRYGRYAIPEDWLEGKRIGFLGDGSKADERGQLRNIARVL
jgi:hypothetical protein